MDNISNLNAACYWGKERDTKIRYLLFSDIKLEVNHEEMITLKQILRKNKIDFEILTIDNQ